MTEREIAAIPTIQAEQPGMGKALGATVGGAVGLAGGMSVAEVALASLVAPGIGPVLAIGLAGGALLGAIGAVTGVQLKATWRRVCPRRTRRLLKMRSAEAVPSSWLLAENSVQEKIARRVLEAGSAKTINRAREMWWLGLRDVEKEHYEASGGNFTDDERYFRASVEAALHSKNRGKSYQEARHELGDAEPPPRKRSVSPRL